MEKLKTRISWFISALEVSLSAFLSASYSNCSTLLPRLFSCVSEPAIEFRAGGYGRALALFFFNTAFPGVEWFLCDDLLIIQNVKIRLDETWMGWKQNRLIKRKTRYKVHIQCYVTSFVHQTQTASGALGGSLSWGMVQPKGFKMPSTFLQLCGHVTQSSFSKIAWRERET